jgi:hypothetical protein
MVYKLHFPYVIVFPMHNYNHDVGFHVGIKGKTSHGGFASLFKVEAILGGKGWRTPKLLDSITSPKEKITKGEGVGVCSLACSTLGVEGCA